MNNYLLTIIIPTLNRLDLLKISLDALVKQVTPFQNSVEFIVVNYVSEDSTAEWLEENYINHPFLKFINYTEQIGIVESVMLCIQMAQGKYVWVFGDDDLPMPFAVENIIKVLQNPIHEDLDIYYFNCVKADVEMKKYINVYDSRVEMEPIEMTTDRLLSEFHLNLGLIITMVFKQQNWIKGKDFYDKEYYGYGWLAPLIAGSKGGKCLYYPFPLSIHRIGAQRYVNKWPLYILVGVPVMFNDFNKKGIINTDALKSWQSTQSLLDFVKVLLVAKAFNYGPKHFLWDRAIQFISDNNKKVALQIFRYLMPTWLAKFAFNFGATVKQTFNNEKLS